MAHESRNEPKLFGWYFKLTFCRVPGGSSGGDAALTSARGTPFGTGSDIGGHI